MTTTPETDKTNGATSNPYSTTVLWIAIAVFLVILVGAVVVFGLPGLVAVAVFAALSMVVIMLRIVTEGM